MLPHIVEAQGNEERTILVVAKCHNRLWLDVFQVNKLEKYLKEDASFKAGISKYLCEFYQLVLLLLQALR